MPIVKRLVSLLLAILILSLAACNMPSDQIPDTGNGETPAVETPGAEVTQVTEPPTALPWDTSTVTPATQTPGFALLCSVLGPGSDPGWNLCRSPEFGFEIQYPPDGELVDQTESSARIDLPFTPGTNLSEKYLQIDVTENDPCSTPLAEGHEPGSIPEGPVEVDSLEFIKQTGEEGAAGSIYTWEAYSISQDGQCISLSFVLRSFQPELEPTPPPVYDREAESQIFTQIVSTFAWLDSGTNPTVTPTTASGQPTPEAERIDFESGATSAVVSGSLEPAGSDLYVLRALEGQTMTVELSFTEGEAILAVWGEDGTVLMSDHAEASRFEGTLPSSQDYFIQVRGRPEGETEYEMEVTIPPVAPGEPTPTPERIEFETGATSATVSGSLPASGSDLYVLSALKGQTMTVELSFTEGEAILAVWGEDGTVLMSDHAEASRFEGVLPSTQDYFIHVRGRPEGETEYEMEVTIPPL